MNAPHNDEHLERLIHRTLRELPPRRAPRSLETRVLAEIQRRAALPWWRKSFVHWPVAARIAFTVLSIAVAGACAAAFFWITGGLDLQPVRDAFRLHFTWLDSARTVFSAIGNFFEIILRNIPALWLYGIVGFVAATYFALFGLGAAAYRALRPHRASGALLSAS